MTKLATYADPSAPMILRLEGNIFRLNNKIVALKRQYDIPWDEDDLVDGRCTVNDIRFQNLPESHVEI